MMNKSSFSARVSATIFFVLLQVCFEPQDSLNRFCRLLDFRVLISFDKKARQLSIINY